MPAPTSTSIDVAKARDFIGPAGGFLYTILEVCGLRLRPGDLSTYNEAEVLLMGPLVYKVKSSIALPGNVVQVTCMVMPKNIDYLAPMQPEIIATAEVVIQLCNLIIPRAHCIQNHLFDYVFFMALYVLHSATMTLFPTLILFHNLTHTHTHTHINIYHFPHSLSSAYHHHAIR